MNKNREMIPLRFLALILLALFLPGCLGGGAKGTPLPPAQATTSNQGEPATATAVGATAVGATEVAATNTPLAENAASPTPAPGEVSNPTETPLPPEATPIPSPTSPAAIVPTNTEAPTNIEAPAPAADVYEPIPGCASSRLHWGDTIRISEKIEYVKIRSTPDTHPADNIVRKLYRSELAKITGLPVCNYGWILWPIQTADGTRGWVPESDGTDFWLVNYNSYFFPSPTVPSR